MILWPIYKAADFQARPSNIHKRVNDSKRRISGVNIVKKGGFAIVI